MIQESCEVVSAHGEVYHLNVYLNPNDEISPVVINLPFTSQRMNVDQFKTLLKMLLRFDEQL